MPKTLSGPVDQSWVESCCILHTNGFNDYRTSCRAIIIASGTAAQLNFRGLKNLFTGTPLEVNTDISDMNLDSQLQVLFTVVPVGTQESVVFTVENFCFESNAHVCVF